MNEKNYTVSLEEDAKTGDLILPLPEEILLDMGWAPGDTIEWRDNQNGSWSLIKKIDKTVK